MADMSDYPMYWHGSVTVVVCTSGNLVMLNSAVL